ncbi:hypothetical protein [Halobacillus litoralis]|uniref:hypothetical protein n=1 Tax=Halobacillus litoralis TaxID=45668 RepID=UPI001CD45810|nr:hypothetical protein [Halobacillus litoralis]MCA1023154.1 hypothetical protein [Halobacillus litoralis]
METIFNQSIENRQVIDMIYLSEGKHWSQRSVRVIKNHPDAVLAYCLQKRSVRTFLKKNIYSADIQRRNKRNRTDAS